MGNYINKYFSHNTEIHSIEFEREIKNSTRKDAVILEEDAMQTPRIIHKIFPVDPRSVTSGIDRTPIEINSTPVGLNRRVISAIPKHLQSKPYLETDIDKAMLCLTPRKCFVPRVVVPEKLETPDMLLEDVENISTPTANNLSKRRTISAIDKARYKILGLDPRSPAANFDRTPILMPKSLQRLRARSQENLQRRGSYDTDIYYPKLSFCEISSQFNLTEIQALPDLAASTVKSLDLVNLNYDDQWNDSCSSHSSRSESFSVNCNEITVIEDSFEDAPENKICKDSIKPGQGALALPKIEFNLDEMLRNSKQDNCDDIEKNTESKETCFNENDIVEVWKDSLVLDESEEAEKSESEDAQVPEKRILQPSKAEVIITFDDDNIAKDTLSFKLSKCEGENARLDIAGKKKRVSKPYDEKKVFNSNDKNGNENGKIRTPLGNRSNNGQMQPLLINSPQQMFRNKGITPKMLQENTPPHKKYVAKSKLSGIQWDPDSTVII